MTKPLEGIKVLDMTHVQAGPACTQMMGFLGAEVIKIERRGSGDMTRGWLQDRPGVDSLYFTMFNGNKRSIELDMKSPQGKDVLTKLVKQSDVLVENFGPGVVPVDSENRIRVDDWEMADDVQAEVAKLMDGVTEENIAERGDLEGYKHDFLNINGFDVDGVDYNKDVTDMSSLD